MSLAHSPGGPEAMRAIFKTPHVKLSSPLARTPLQGALTMAHVKVASTV